jgi:hypothetical protein
MPDGHKIRLEIAAPCLPIYPFPDQAVQNDFAHRRPKGGACSGMTSCETYYLAKRKENSQIREMAHISQEKKERRAATYKKCSIIRLEGTICKMKEYVNLPGNHTETRPLFHTTLGNSKCSVSSLFVPLLSLACSN